MKMKALGASASLALPDKFISSRNLWRVFGEMTFLIAGAFVYFWGMLP